MSICPNTGYACRCQPQEGVMCAYGPTPDDWHTAPAAPSAPTGEELPKWIDDHKGADPFMDDVIAYIESMQRQYAERIRQLERELAERKTASIDTPEFWQQLSTHVNNCGSGPDKAVLESRAALIAYIDGRTAGAAWISVDDARKPNVGTPVLVYVRTLTNGEDDDGRPYAEEGAVIDIGEYKKASYDGEHYFACFMSPISDNDWITHWMPLPAEPIATKEA